MGVFIGGCAAAVSLIKEVKESNLEYVADFITSLGFCVAAVCVLLCFLHLLPEELRRFQLGFACTIIGGGVSMGMCCAQILVNEHADYNIIPYSWIPVVTVAVLCTLYYLYQLYQSKCGKQN